jgi:hypothetical protein
MTYPSDDDQEELEDREFPDAADLDDDSTDSESCPRCGRPVYAGADLCPHCRQYVSEEDSPASRRPRWFIIGVVVTLVVIFVVWILLRVFGSE